MFRVWLVSFALVAYAQAAERIPEATDPKHGEDLFTRGLVPHMRIEIPPEGIAVLRDYVQVWGKPRPERIDVQATVREGKKVYTNVAIHLKGSFTFQPIDAKPSLTLNFDKFASGQRFHGLTKIHLNNSIQDRSYLCEALARELFDAAGVPSPRIGHALVNLNDRDLGLFVMVEGATKQFVKRHFESAKGNLYDGGSGGDVTKALKVDCGEHPEDRSDLTNLVKAAREPDPTKRLVRLEQVLDVDRFLSFVATEVFLVHWDGYALGPNNFRIFHDVPRDKMIFMPHGLDQIFGVSSSLTLPVTPHFDGIVARALTSIPEGRKRYLDRLGNLFTNQFQVDALNARLDRLAGQLRPQISSDAQMGNQFDQALRNLKARIVQRVQNVGQQLAHPKQPLSFANNNAEQLSGWRFKTANTRPAIGGRTREDGREILQVRSRGAETSGSWRTLVLLDEGRYELTGKGRSEGLTDAKGTNLLLRVSGERSPQGVASADDWTTLTYEFDVRGIVDVELVCEFRGPEGAGFFDASSLRLIRKGALPKL